MDLAISVAVTIASGVHGDGRREVLGTSAPPSPRSSGSHSCAQAGGARPARRQADDLRSKRRRDANFWRDLPRCRVNLIRNLLAHPGRQGSRVAASFVAAALAQKDVKAAKARWREVVNQLQARRPSSPQLSTRRRAMCAPAWTSHRPPSCQIALNQPARTPQRRGEATH